MICSQRETDGAVFMSPEFWSADACARARMAIDDGHLSPAEIFAGDYHVDEGIRRTLDSDVDPIVVRQVDEAIARVRPQLSRFFATPLVGSEGPGFLRYLPGGFYGPHYDCLPDMEGEFPRRISVVLFLTDADATSPKGCRGGTLRIYGPPGDPTGDAPLDIAPVMGTLVAFRATWLHEVLPVTAGVRDVIVDWFY